MSFASWVLCRLLLSVFNPRNSIVEELIKVLEKILLYK